MVHRVARFFGLLALVFGLLIVVALPAASVAAAQPLTLNNEGFSIGPVNSSYNCNLNGTVTFSASGTASGPYPGTFTESGSATVTGHRVTALSATFTIASSAGTVSGSFAATTFTAEFACFQDADNADIPTTSAPYEATITTPDGTRNESGKTLVSLRTQNGVVTVLGQSFAASDTTPPVIADPAVSGARGTNGWYTSDVTVTWQVTDAESMIADTTGCGPTTVGAETTGSTIVCTATSAGGTSSKSVTIKLDKTPPTNVVGTPDRQPNAAGWYNAPVTVAFSGQDATSGILAEGCTSPAYSGPDSAAASVSGSCTDNAGNVGSGAFILKYDATKPTVTYSTHPASYTIDQTVSITCIPADGLSRIASSTCANISGPASTFDPGANTFSASATDNAGNVGSGSTSFTVTVDAASLAKMVNQFVANKGIAHSLATKIMKGNVAPFINEVNAQTGKALTSEQAAILIKWANAL